MSKILIVLKAEYLRAVRSKAFVIGVLLTPILFGGGAIAFAVAEQATDLRERRFAVIDHTGELRQALADRLALRNEALLDEQGKPGKARWTLVSNPEVPAGERLDVVLSEQVETQQLLGFLEIGPDLLSTDTEGDRTLAWHTESPTYDDLSDWLENELNVEVRGRRLTAAGIDAELAGRLTRWDNVRTLGLVQLDAAGEVKADSEIDQIARVAVPVVLVVMLFMLVMMSTPALMNNVLEEKMQKIAEVLVSSVTPFELLAGKLLSAVLVSLTLAIVYLGGALVFLNTVDGIPPPILAAVTPGVLAWFMLFLLLSLLINGSIFSGLGAACSEIQDTQTLMMPAMIVLVLPMMVLGVLIKSPDGMIAQVLTFVPPVTPVVLFLRINVPPGAPLWQVVVALLLCIAFTWGCVWAAGKIFRIGVLSQGQAPSYRKLLGWLLSD